MHKYTIMHVSLHTQLYIDIFKHIQTCASFCTYIHTNGCLPTCILTWIDEYMMHAHMHTCMYVYQNMYTFIMIYAGLHTYIHTYT